MGQLRHRNPISVASADNCVTHCGQREDNFADTVVMAGEEGHWVGDKPEQPGSPNHQLRLQMDRQGVSVQKLAERSGR